jgi:hypothetical protein
LAATFEYWTAVFGVGIDGFSDFDHDELNAIAAEGWEPVQLTAVHGGFATLVLFRREAGAQPRPEPTKKAAKKAAGAKKVAKSVRAR